MSVFPNLQGAPALIKMPPCSNRADMPVSWDKEGNPVSFYTDLTWNLTAFSPKPKPCNFNFSHWCVKRKYPSLIEMDLISELHNLIFLIIFKRSGNPLSVTTVRHYFDLLVMVCRYALKNEIGLGHVLSVDDIFIDFLNSHNQNQLRSLAQLVSTLQQFDISDLGFVPVGRTMLVEVRARQVEYRSEVGERQHPPLPTRIYSLFISNLLEDLSYNEAIIDGLLGLVERANNFREIPSNERPKKYIEVLLDEFGLAEHFAQRGIGETLKSINRALLEIFVSCKLVIHTFSGMRDGEVEFLPYNCLEPVSGRGKKHYMIKGFTTKFADGKKKRAKWVTSKEAYRAVEVVKKISAVIYRLALGGDHVPDDAPLFLAPGLLIKGFGDELRGPRLDLCYFKTLVDRLMVAITHEDLQELQDVDPFRMWALDKEFKVGSKWHLTVHQLRRSLALYATRSGLVTLPSLKRQLQHITEEMSRYYSSGSFFAKNLLETYDDHISVQYAKAQPESQALAFIKNVLSSPDPSFGPKGIWYRKPPENVEISREEFKETQRKARNGLISYTETPIGGCMNSGDCIHRSFGVFSHCVTKCDQSVIKVASLRKLIVSQEGHVAKLDAATVVWKNEMAILDDYKTALDRIINKGG